jgi:hypothetical protein
MNPPKNTVVGVTLVGFIGIEALHSDHPHLEIESVPEAVAVRSVNDEALVALVSGTPPVTIEPEPVTAHASVVEPVVGLGEQPEPVKTSFGVVPPGIKLTPPDQPLVCRSGVIMTVEEAAKLGLS